MAFRTFSNPICPSGSEYKLMVSGMSKFARRNEIKLANYCAFDLYLAGFQEVGNETELKTQKNYRTRFINRFVVAIIEDNMPYCHWVLSYIHKFTVLCSKSFIENKPSKECLKLISFLISNIAESSKCRFMQHLREVGDDEYRSIEININNGKFKTRNQSKKYFINFISKFEKSDKAQKYIDCCMDVFDIQGKSVVLSAAASYLQYENLIESKNIEIKEYNFDNLYDFYQNNTPNWKMFPYLFDKHVSNSIAKKYQVCAVKGWKGFIENEENLCWENSPAFMKCSNFFINYKLKYCNARLEQ